MSIAASISVCRGTQAAVHHFHGMPKYQLSEKVFGVYRHRNLAPASPYLRGFSDDFSIPVSRWTEVRREDIPAQSGMSILMELDEAGLCLLDDPAHRSLHMFNHIEYDSNSLSDEYFRDLAANKPIATPRNYFPKDDPRRQPENCWWSHCPSAVRELDQSTLPDHALRYGEDRKPMRPRPRRHLCRGALSWKRDDFALIGTETDAKLGYEGGRQWRCGVSAAPGCLSRSLASAAARSGG